MMEIHKVLFSLLLMVGVSNSYAKKTTVQESASDAVAVAANEAKAVASGADDSDAQSACNESEDCDVVSAVSVEGYGQIEKEYVVKGCKVTIYHEGPIKMVGVKTGKPCNAPIPKDHNFGGTTRVYQEDGCTVTEQTSKGGLIESGSVCP